MNLGLTRLWGRRWRWGNVRLINDNLVGLRQLSVPFCLVSLVHLHPEVHQCVCCELNSTSKFESDSFLFVWFSHSKYDSSSQLQVFQTIFNIFVTCTDVKCFSWLISTNSFESFSCVWLCNCVSLSQCSVFIWDRYWDRRVVLDVVQVGYVRTTSPSLRMLCVLYLLLKSRHVTRVRVKFVLLLTSRLNLTLNDIVNDISADGFSIGNENFGFGIHVKTFWGRWASWTPRGKQGTELRTHKGLVHIRSLTLVWQSALTKKNLFRDITVRFEVWLDEGVHSWFCKIQKFSCFLQSPFAVGLWLNNRRLKQWLIVFFFKFVQRKMAHESKVSLSCSGWGRRSGYGWLRSTFPSVLASGLVPCACCSSDVSQTFAFQIHELSWCEWRLRVRLKLSLDQRIFFGVPLRQCWTRRDLFELSGLLSESLVKWWLFNRFHIKFPLYYPTRLSNKFQGRNLIMKIKNEKI